MNLILNGIEEFQVKENNATELVLTNSCNNNIHISKNSKRYKYLIDRSEFADDKVVKSIYEAHIPEREVNLIPDIPQDLLNTEQELSALANLTRNNLQGKHTVRELIIKALENYTDEVKIVFMSMLMCYAHKQILQTNLLLTKDIIINSLKWLEVESQLNANNEQYTIPEITLEHYKAFQNYIRCLEQGKNIDKEREIKNIFELHKKYKYHMCICLYGFVKKKDDLINVTKKDCQMLINQIQIMLNK